MEYINDSYKVGIPCKTSAFLMQKFELNFLREGISTNCLDKNVRLITAAKP